MNNFSNTQNSGLLKNVYDKSAVDPKDVVKAKLRKMLATMKKDMALKTKGMEGK